MNTHRLSMLVAVAALAVGLGVTAAPAQSIRPWPSNKFYWEYKDQPVLLLGGTNNDNLFQSADAKAQLDLLASVGGNYIRNTMSDRPDDGNEIKAFKKLSSGQYDLNQWNDAYWIRFSDMLVWAEQRNIIVGIEVWDRFDHSRDPWLTDPYNPANNVNYTTSEAGLATTYPNHPGTNDQPFFKTVPAMQNNTVVLNIQKKFVDKMLSYTLFRPNVIYAMDNETAASPEWGKYWAKYIRAKAGAAGKTVFLTEMWDDRDLTGPQHRNTLDHPEIYDFIDISQNNHQINQTHWDRMQWVRQYLIDRNRAWPLNTTKIYGADGGAHGGNSNDAMEKFWRQIIGGVAVSRFHRPTSGIGLNSQAQNCIKAARLLESRIKMWNVDPRQDLLTDRGSNEAYLSAKPGESYALYFTNGGSVGLKLGGHSGEFEMRWIDADGGTWGSTQTISGGATRTINAPGGGDWVAAIVKKSSTPLPPPPAPDPDPTPTGSVTSLTLVNADADQDIQTLNSGAMIDLNQVGLHLSVRANVSGSVASTVFKLDGATVRTENSTPYAIAGDDPSGDYNPWTPPVGSHTLTVTPYSSSGGSGTAGTAKTVNFTVVNNVPPPPTPDPTPDPGIDGLIAHWDLNESSGSTANDVSGNDGTLHGATWTAGRLGSALQFDGNSDYVEIPHHSSYLLNHGTVAFWFRSENLSGSHGLFSKDSNTFDTGGHLTISMEDNQLRARLQSTSVSTTLFASTTLQTDRWYHVAFKFGSGGTKLYLDGKLEAGDAYAGGLGASSGGTGNHESIVLGASSALSDDLKATPLQDYFKGKIDDVRLYDHGLSESKIDALAHPAAPVSLPSGWSTQDVGDVSKAGAAGHSSGTFSVSGSGADIWKAADEFRYVFQALQGDGEITAHVTGQTNTDPWAKAGVMIRQSLSDDSKHAMVIVSAENGVAFQRRAAAGGSSNTVAYGSKVVAPHWVRLVRRGDLFEGYESVDGQSWTKLGSTMIAMGESVYIGLAVTAHHDGLLSTANFENVKILGGAIFLESGGRVVMEAEHYTGQAAGSSAARLTGGPP